MANACIDTTVNKSCLVLLKRLITAETLTMAAVDGGFLQSMESMLECRICLCLLDDPKGLQCQHVYCKDCLDDLLKFHPDGSATFSCVMKCEGVVVIDSRGTTNDLSSPYQLKGILDMYKSQNK